MEANACLKADLVAMLLEFRVQNHRSILEEQVLSFEPSERGDRTPLHAVAIYGANASGKSNVLSALTFMRSAVLGSHRRWDPEDGIPRDPFAWPASPSPDSLFEVTFTVDGTRYDYGFVASDQCFVEEWLYAWPRNRRQKWFTRDHDEFRFSGDYFKGENEIVKQVTRPNALFLSVAAQHNHHQLTRIYKWFRDIHPVGIPTSRWGRALVGGPPPDYWFRNLLAHSVPSNQMSLFGSDGNSPLSRLRDLLQAADIGITDIKVERDADTSYSSTARSRLRVYLRHRHPEKEAWLPLEQESHGTQTLLRMASPILGTLQRGGLLVIDELEASLHPLLAQHIVKQFSNPETNRANGQLLFTTHDTNLLGSTIASPVLRRDQVWLTEKNDSGATCLYPLSDYKPRKAENLERGYLQGRYGAIPFLGDLGARAPARSLEESREGKDS